MPGGWSMSMTWVRMPGRTWSACTASFMLMWTVMMVAMMLPCLVPMLLIYRRSLSEQMPVRGRTLAFLTSLVAAAYFSVWIILGALIYPLGIALADAEMRFTPLSQSVPIITALVLFLAGALQFTPWKACQLRCCRQAQLLSRDAAPSPQSALLHGARLGGNCTLCCSGLMAALLAIGIMDLTAMALATIAMAAERLAPRPTWFARTTGALAIAAGVWEVVQALSAA
jgi:predicted metal-binding membrane protein